MPGVVAVYSAANLEELSKGAGRYVLATPIRNRIASGCVATSRPVRDSSAPANDWPR